MTNDSLMISIERTIRVPAGEVFRAFTNATALREWLSDFASSEPRPGGRIYLYWNSGTYDAGSFTKVEQDRLVEFDLNTNLETAPLTVRVSLAPAGDSTALQLTQSGFRTTETRDLLQSLWTKSLENLVSVLEEGPDLRITTRPMMGVYFDPLNEKTAKELGVPVSSGSRIADLMPGLGAAKAGLQKDDVIVEMNGIPQVDFSDYLKAIQGKVGGDVIPVAFYRGGVKKTVDMELGKRKMPEVPVSTVELAEKVAAAQQAVDKNLDAVLQNVSEEAASRRPAEGEWNVKENLAHLLQYERFLQSWVSDMYFSAEPVADGNGQNLPAWIKATADVYGTLPAILEEFKRNQAELVALIENLPAEFAKRKSSWWRIGVHLLTYCDHTQAHVDQIKAALGS